MLNDDKVLAVGMTELEVTDERLNVEVHDEKIHNEMFTGELIEELFDKILAEERLTVDLWTRWGTLRTR